VLTGLLLPAVSRAKESARSVQCLNRMRQIGLAVRFYADDNLDEFPRSQHSAFAHGQLPWGRSVAVQLGEEAGSWTNLLDSIYHCPSDKRKQVWSYAQNVYFELDPETDDYEGSPRTWRRAGSVRSPVSTLMQAENAGPADHIMPHFWMTLADASDVASDRHGERANYNFVDGHAEARRFDTIYDPERQVDAWNPFRAP